MWLIFKKIHLNVNCDSCDKEKAGLLWKLIGSLLNRAHLQTKVVKIFELNRKVNESLLLPKASKILINYHRAFISVDHQTVLSLGYLEPGTNYVAD